MKKNIIVMGIFLLVVALAGCAVAKDLTPKENVQLNEEKINFERVNYEGLNSEIKATIDGKKMHKGHTVIKDKESDYYYLVVFAGEKNTGGYGIEITEVVNEKGETNVMVKETSPAEGMMTIQVLTYPLDVIKIKGITKNIKITKDSESMGEKKAELKNYVTIGKIIEFEKDSVHVLTGDIAEAFNVDKEKAKDFYLGETVAVKEVDNNEFELEVYKKSDFNVRHTNMGEIITTISGKIKEVNGNKFILETKDGDISFEAYNELTLENGREVTVDYIEFQPGNGEKTLLDIYDEVSKINLTVKKIRRAENTGMMIIDTEDKDALKYEVYVLGKSILNFNHSDLKADDKITVYPEAIREIYPAQIDAKMIKR